MRFSLFLFLLSFIFAREKELDFADSLFGMGSFEIAIREYQRFIFYNFSSPSVSYARYQSALSYLKRDKEDWRLKGEGILRDITFNPNEDSHLRKMAFFSLIRYYTTNRYYETGKSLINRLLREGEREKEELIRAKAFILAREGKIKEAQDLLLSIGDTLLYPRIKGIRLPKKEWLASFFSLFLPGAGEFYCGRYKEGIGAFLVTGLSGYCVYYSLKNNKRLDALLIFSFLFLRFYQGSIKNSFHFAQRYNERYLEKRLNGLAFTP